MTRLVDVRTGHANTPFLRAIGAMTIAARELETLRNEAAGAPAGVLVGDSEGWIRFADHLLGQRDAVLDAAATSTFPGNTLSIEAEAGVRIAIEPDYIDKLAHKMERHARIGAALGIGLTDTLEPVAS
jgi:hypothetical protein